MTIKVKNYQEVKKLQEGGEMPAEAPVEGGAPAPEQGGDPTEQILMACQQALETQDCNLAMQVLQAIMQMLGGGGAPEAAAPEGAAPVYKMGGKFSKWVQK